jgi:hypothetical protein
VGTQLFGSLVQLEVSAHGLETEFRSGSRCGIDLKGRHTHGARGDGSGKGTFTSDRTSCLLTLHAILALADPKGGKR